MNWRLIFGNAIRCSTLRIWRLWVSHFIYLNLHLYFIVGWMSRNSLLETGATSKVSVTATAFEQILLLSVKLPILCLFRRFTMASLTKWLSVRVQTKRLWVRIPLLSITPVYLEWNVFNGYFSFQLNKWIGRISNIYLVPIEKNWRTQNFDFIYV